jgi:predicted O-methyltransferase YrrM
VARRRPEPLLRPRQGRYLAQLLPPREALAAEIELAAARHRWRTVAPAVARLWEALAAREPASRVVEVGCGVGYGTLHLARGAAAGTVVAIDEDGAALAHARRHLERGGVAARVELAAGRVGEIVDRLAGPIDLAVVDAARVDEPRRALDLLLPLVRIGGTLAFAGLLADGRVADPALRDEDDARAAALERFNPYLAIHPQLTAVLLPLGDGVGLAVKRRPTVRELGGPY